MNLIIMDFRKIKIEFAKKLMKLRKMTMKILPY